MKKIMITVISLFLLITMVSIGGKNQMERKKWEALYQRGFLMLEEQIAYYITENYTGISKIEFSPILYRDGGGASFSSAEVVPVIYDNYGNKAYLSHDVDNTTPVRHGLYSGLWALEFNYEGNPVIYISSDEGEMDVSDYEHLPEKAKMTKDEGWMIILCC